MIDSVPFMGAILVGADVSHPQRIGCQYENLLITRLPISLVIFSTGKGEQLGKSGNVTLKRKRVPVFIYLLLYI